MMIKQRGNREQVEIFSIEEFVPSDHLLRKIDRAIDFTHIYDFVEDLYCADNGRPSIDPVVKFKMVLIQHLYVHTVTEKNSRRNQNECSLQMVSGIFNERSNTALFHKSATILSIGILKRR